MSSKSAEAHGLPANAPPFGEERPLCEPARFAIFHTVPMDHRACQDLEQLINKVGSGDANHSKLAPTPDFSGRSLREVYECFLALRNEDESIQPFYFIIADQADSEANGVLVVYLNCDNNGDGVVGVARCPVDMADGWGADFYYGFADWEEMRDAEQVEYDSEDKDEEFDPDLGYDPRPNSIQLRSMYGWYSLVENAVPINHMLDPLWLDKHPDECRFQMLGNYHASNEPWVDISREHPLQSAFRLRIHRQIVLVAEKEDANEPDGIVIIRLESHRQPKRLASVSADTAIEKADALVQQLELWNP